LCNSQPLKISARKAEVGTKFSRLRNSTETLGAASSTGRSTNVETGDNLEHDEGWESVKRLIELAKSAPELTLSPERRRRLRDGLLQRLERDRIERAERQRMRRRVAGAFVAGASTMLLAGLLLKLVSGGHGVAPSSAALARQQAAQQSVAE
jgi:hypothetical protein